MIITIYVKQRNIMCAFEIAAKAICHGAQTARPSTPASTDALRTRDVAALRVSAGGCLGKSLGVE